MGDTKLKKVADALPEKVRELAKYDLFELGKNAKHTVQSMMESVFDAALNATSIEIISEVKMDCPSADTIRGHLNWKVAIDDSEAMMKSGVKPMVTLICRKFNRTSFDIAIDWTDEMTWGDSSNPLVVGTEPKKGTCWAYQFFTVSIVDDKARFLLFAYPLFSRENLLYYVNRALLFLRELHLSISTLYFDRGFRSVDLFAFLKDEKINFITPAVQDGKFERKVSDVKKFPVRFNGWQMENSDGETVEIDLVVTEEFVKNRKGEMKKRLCGFFTNLSGKIYEERPELIAEMYRRRWGIETAHRCEDSFRIKSTSVSGIVRYLYFVVSMLVYNLWAYLNLLFCEDDAEYAITIKKDALRLLCGRLFGKFLI